jgi:hypothetical protein
MRKHVIAGVVVMAGLLLAGPRLLADDAAITPFLGAYVGKSIQAPKETLSPRDLGIKISRHGENGFTLEWTTVIRSFGQEKHQSYSIDFTPSPRPGIFSSAMHRDTFGHAEPLDPLKGEPYVWANIAGPTLTVHALLITDDGGYEIQVYQRTLTSDGMTLTFSRNRNGQELKTVSGALVRSAE